MHDPHGDPIPDADLRIDRVSLRTLASLEPWDEATIRRVPDGDDELLRYLKQLALVPGRRRSSVRRSPSAARSRFEWGESDHAISRELAAGIGVA